MFDLLALLRRGLGLIARPARRLLPPGAAKAARPARAEDTPSVAEGLLRRGGLSLLLLGLLYGGVYALFFLDRLHDERQELAGQALLSASQGQVERAGELNERVAAKDALMSALGSGHGHLSLFGLVALALAGSMRRPGLKEKWRLGAALLLLAGGLLLPAGTVLQPLADKTLGKVIAVFGGTALTASLATFWWGARQ